MICTLPVLGQTHLPLRWNRAKNMQSGQQHRLHKHEEPSDAKKEDLKTKQTKTKKQPNRLDTEVITEIEHQT